jgi:hypothetical protein
LVAVVASWLKPGELRGYEEKFMKVNTLTTRRKILYIVGISVGCLLIVEWLARITSGPRWLNPHYVEISSEFADLEALIADTQNTHPAPKYYDEFLYAAAPVSTGHINFTDYYSARWTPDSVPLSEAENIIWTFGGSTMENTETTDSLTIANTWARMFNASLGPSHVKNFGAGGFFSSYELIKFQKLLREVPQSELPNIAIFYDGFNDALFGFQYGPGRPQTDLSLKLQALVEHDDITTGAYAISRTLSTYSRFWERTAARLVEHLLFPLAEPDTGAANLDQAVRIYTSNVRMIQATCQVFEIHCYFILQALVVTKKPLSQVEQDVLNNLEAHPRFAPEGTRFIREFYKRMIEEFADDEHFIDASHILDGRSEPDFYDLGHVGALRPPVIGEKTGRLLLDRLVSTPGFSALEQPDLANASGPGQE